MDQLNHLPDDFGPEFLWMEKREWPQQPSIQAGIAVVEPEEVQDPINVLLN